MIVDFFYKGKRFLLSDSCSMSSIQLLLLFFSIEKNILWTDVVWSYWAWYHTKSRGALKVNSTRYPNKSRQNYLALQYSGVYIYRTSPPQHKVNFFLNSKFFLLSGQLPYQVVCVCVCVCVYVCVCDSIQLIRLYKLNWQHLRSAVLHAWRLTASALAMFSHSRFHRKTPAITTP